MKERKIVDVLAQAFGERHDDRKDHRGCPDDRCADQHGFGSSLEGVAGAVVGFQHFLGAPKIHVDVVILLELSFDARNLFNQGKLIDRLRIVGDRTVGVDGNGHRAHAKKAESHQTEGKHGRSEHLVVEPKSANQKSERHEQHHRQADVVRRKIAGHEAGKNAKRCAALFGRGNYFFHVPRLGGGEYLYEFGNDSARERAARNDRGQLPPLRSVAAEARNDH